MRPRPRQNEEMQEVGRLDQGGKTKMAYNGITFYSMKLAYITAGAELINFWD